MRAFLSEDLLLTTAAAWTLYRSYAAKQPVIDLHCHIDPREIYEDRQFDDLAQLWLGGGRLSVGGHCPGGLEPLQ